MSMIYKYTWKHGISISSKRHFEFKKPLLVGMVLVDLLNGETYRVHSIYKAKEHDRMSTLMPEDVAHTFPFGVTLRGRPT
jgi:hypothetical protein